MRLIIVSPPDDFPHEPEVVDRILQQSSATYHLRKPGQRERQLAAYLKRVPAVHHHRIMVHDHPQLLSQFDLKGIHFTEKARQRDQPRIRQLKQDRPGCRLASAFHRITDIPEPDGLFDYILLSPIFDSISKQGYRAAFVHADLKHFLHQTDHTVVALGGIDGQRVATAASLGFKGVAVLGAVWGARDPENAARQLSAVCCAIQPFPVHGAQGP